MWPHHGGQGLRVGDEAGKGVYPSGSFSVKSLGFVLIAVGKPMNVREGRAHSQNAQLHSSG